MRDELLLQRIDFLINQINIIKKDTQNVSLAEFGKSDLLIRATAFSVVQIGEQTVKLEEELKTKYPFVKWTQIRGMRNFIVHDYGNVDIQELFKTIHEDLDDLYCSMIEIRKDIKTKKDSITE